MGKIREADVEDYLVKRVAAYGGVAEKYSSPNRASVPDRLVFWSCCDISECDFPNHQARVVFVECKALGKMPTAAQARDHERRRKMGFRVYVVDSRTAVELFLKAEGF